MSWIGRITMIVLLLLTAATLLGWARSRWSYDTLDWSQWWPSDAQYDGVTLNLTSGRGVVGLSIYRLYGFPTALGARRSSGFSYTSGKAQEFELPQDTRCRRLGFGTLEDVGGPVSGIRGATVSMTAWWAPYWFLAAAFSIVPALQFALSRPLRARHRRRTGLCVKCGYDLRASADRCPECGAPFECYGGDSSLTPRGQGESKAISS